MSVAEREPGESSAPDRVHRRRSQRQVDESLQNRKAIVRNALELFANYGYTKTTLHAIAERVGLTRQGLLHHFQSKEGLFVEVINYERGWAEQQIAQLRPERGLKGLRSMAVFLGSEPNALHLKFVHTIQGEAIHQDAPDYLVTYVQARLNSIRGNIEQQLREAHSDGEIGDVDVPTLATMIVGTIVGLQTQWLADDAVQTEPAFDQLVALLAAVKTSRRRTK
jgi:AcrR family transcriptional regulator